MWWLTIEYAGLDIPILQTSNYLGDSLRFSRACQCSSAPAVADKHWGKIEVKDKSGGCKPLPYSKDPLTLGG